ncbi:MAG TPA: NADH-quinone oxidoreductase subunit NuoF [Candidatus Polarisedimenticolia bacterium]|nr:NADH-quinone oxidoreductase subunit NuoF [Candidatus Polarisedimenticolia bacterium]
MAYEPLLTRNLGKPGSETLDVYLATGGYQGLRRVLKEQSPEKFVEEVKASGLRGRGGAGFPTGMKWGFLPKTKDRPRYLCVNADESEPGTFKDRLLIESDPHLLLEGIICSAYAIECHTAFFYIRGEFYKACRIFRQAVDEAYAKGYLGKNILGSGYDLDVVIYRGAGAYICGEETALLESLEGKRGLPRIKPPFPAVVGLYGCPTIINNVETLANVTLIAERGAAWYAAIGRPPKNTGPKLYCVSGHVARPGVYEAPLGIPLTELINERAGGMLRPDRPLKAVVPGGSSMRILPAAKCDVAMDFDSLVAAGSMLGSAGVIVMDSSTCIVWALRNLAGFYAHESCGQCTPCREGTGWFVKILDRLEAGRGRPEDVDLLIDVASRVEGHTICPFGEAIAWPVDSYVRAFREEFQEHVARRGCPLAAAAVH